LAVFPPKEITVTGEERHSLGPPQRGQNLVVRHPLPAPFESYLPECQARREHLRALRVGQVLVEKDQLAFLWL
jgi:hypothetical protein